MNLFTTTERTQLRAVSKSVRSDWRNYFFKPLQSFNEFQDIHFSMRALQWHYLYSSFKNSFEAFSLLFETAYSLVTNVNEAPSYAQEMMEANLSGVAKATLAAAFLFLTYLRMSTLLLVTSMPFIVKWLPPEQKKDDKISKETAVEMENLRRTVADILEDNSVINKVIENFEQEVDYFDQRATKFFSYCSQNRLFECTEKTDRLVPPDKKLRTLTSDLDELRSNYPQYDSTIKDPEYIRWIILRLDEHHSRTREIANLFFEHLKCNLKDRNHLLERYIEQEGLSM